MLNSPSNPLGKVYTRAELEQVAALCLKHNCLCLCDEVYHQLTYDAPFERIGLLNNQSVSF